MSEVKRYRADHRHVVETEFDDAQYVGVADYDSTKSELAVLREENRILQKQLGECWTDISSLRESLEAASEELEVASTECHNAKRNERNSEVAYKAAIERQEELRNELAKFLADNPRQVMSAFDAVMSAEWMPLEKIYEQLAKDSNKSRRTSPENVADVIETLREMASINLAESGSSA